MAVDAGPILTALATIAAGGAAFVLGWWRSSGRVRTSEAATLWEASEEFRKDLRDEVAALRDRVTEAEAHTRRCEQENRELRDRVAALERAST